MRLIYRIAKEFELYFRRLLRHVPQAWNAFFFRNSDPTPLGLIRISVGLLLIWNMSVLGSDLFNLMGHDGWVDPETLRRVGRDSGSWQWSLWLWVPDLLLVPSWVGCLCVFALFTVGKWSRTMAILSWIIAVSTVYRAPMVNFGFDQVAVTWLFYLAVTGASGQALSLDRLRWSGVAGARNPRVPAATVSANLALRLIQLHLCFIYAASGFSKLQGPAWWDGSAVALLAGYSEFRTIDFSVMATNLHFASFLTHAIVAFEVTYPVIVWLTLLRPLVVGSAVMFHVGIAVVLGLHEFAAIMIVGNLAFVSGPWLRKLYS